MTTVPYIGESGGDAGLAETFDHSAPELAANFWDVMRSMRSQCPVAHSRVYGGYWVITRYQDVLRVVQDWRTFSSADGVTYPNLVPIRTIPLEIDPPQQTAYRQLLNPYLTPARIARIEPGIRAIADRLIDQVIERGECDVMEDLAKPFPGTVFFEQLLGLTTDDLHDLHDWINTFVYRSQSPEAPEAIANFSAWIQSFIDMRRSGPRRDDFVDALINTPVLGRPVSNDEVLRALFVLINGGLETTSNATGNITLHLATDLSDRQSRLREHPEEIPSFIEEMLRYEAPTVGLARRATRDVELGGQMIKKGDYVVVYYASANRDEAEFERGDEIDLSRERQRHLTFGAGPHRCIGSNLARASLRIVVERMTARLHDLRRANDDPLRYYQSASRGLVALPVRFTAGSRIDARR